MKFTKKDFTIGQEVFIKLTNNASRYKKDDELIEVWVVKSIGNKYVTVGLPEYKWSDEKFEYETGRQKTDYSVDYVLYLSMRDMEDEQEILALRDKIKREYIGKDKLTLNQLRRIVEICEEE